MPSLPAGETVRVRGFQGVACAVIGPELKPGPSEWFDEDSGEYVHDEEPEQIETGRVVVIMVGDDQRFAVEPEDCSPLAEHEYCGGCGQIGCGHGASEERA